jgi:membrane protein required for colicin V production
VLSWVNWFCAFMLAQWFALDAAALLSWDGTAEPLRYATGFVMVFIAVLLLGSALIWVFKKLVSAAGLGVLDRLLGGFFGAARGVLLLLALCFVVGLTPVAQAPAWAQATGPQWARMVMNVLKPLLPQEFEKYVT